MQPVALDLSAPLVIAAETVTLTAQDEVLGPRSAAEAAHVRGLEPRLQALIERGIAVSATFRRLVNELNATDVFVHVRSARMGDGFRGYLVHQVIEANGFRYLRIAVDSRGAEVRVIGLLAHELQHALEVARVPEVGRSINIETFFEKIDDHSCRNARCFETAAAIRIQHDVTADMQ
jgi:hypothetical protein